jgi:hypothetical protein
MAVFPIVCALSIAQMFACGETQRPPAVAEVPINEGTPSKNNPDDPVDNSTTTTTPPPDTGNGSGNGPKPLTDSTPDVDAGGGTAKKGQLGEADCKKVIKKLADFVQKENHQPPIAPSDLENNPVFNPMLTQCQQETTKKQYTCAMAAKNKTGWETCMK